MDLTKQNDTNNNYLQLLEALILQKLSEEELMIGTAYREGHDYAVVSLDEYDRHNINLHLYCSQAGLFFLEIEDFDSNYDAQFLSLRDEDLAVIPEGLRTLMLCVAKTGKSVTFGRDQLNP
jgi:Na+-transporting NADH:ubiquinone oxidoreductase subunit NqrA